MQQQRRPLVNQVRRDAWIEINLGHIENNIIQFKKYINKDVKILAVVKADSYGLGSVTTASTLLAAGVYMFGVASVDEGLQLRNSGITAPILVLGATPDWAVESCIQNDISISIFNEEHIKICKHLFEKYKKPVRAHIKVNTGMNRIGVKYNLAEKFIEQSLKEESLNIKGIFSHLACAETPERANIQLNRFLNIYNKFKNEDLIFHIANTSAIIAYPKMQFDMVRLGIGISGMSPDLPEGIEIPLLKESLELKARVVNITEIEQGEGVSYGYTFIAKDKRKLATIPLGYADGVSRLLSNKIYGLIHGKKVPQVGNITMDQMIFDVTEIEDIKKGDIITLIGSDGDNFISIDEWARILGTINYEISCNLKVRLPRIYTR